MCSSYVGNLRWRENSQCASCRRSRTQGWVDFNITLVTYAALVARIEVILGGMNLMNISLNLSGTVLLIFAAKESWKITYTMMN